MLRFHLVFEHFQLNEMKIQSIYDLNLQIIFPPTHGRPEPPSRQSHQFVVVELPSVLSTPPRHPSSSSQRHRTAPTTSFYSARAESHVLPREAQRQRAFLGCPPVCAARRATIMAAHARSITADDSSSTHVVEEAPPSTRVEDEDTVSCRCSSCPAV